MAQLDGIEDLDEVITIFPKRGSNSYGAAIFGEPYSAECYLEPQSKLIRNKIGEEVVCTLKGVFLPNCSIDVGDEAIWSGKRYKALSVFAAKLFGVVHHVEIDFSSVAG